MWPNRTTWLVLFAVSFWLVSVSQTQPSDHTGLTLFTIQEAEQLQLEGEMWQQSTLTRALPLGPHILIQRPQVKETSSGRIIEAITPTDLQILFEANGAPVDIDSLQVEASKGLFTKSLTSLLRPYITGMTLQAKEVRLPKGNFLIKIAVADIAGAKTVETYRLEVKEQE